jgi:hypothetical protein
MQSIVFLISLALYILFPISLIDIYLISQHGGHKPFSLQENAKAKATHHTHFHCLYHSNIIFSKQMLGRQIRCKAMARDFQPSAIALAAIASTAITVAIAVTVTVPLTAVAPLAIATPLAAGTLKDKYIWKVPLPRGPQVHSTSEHVASTAAVMSDSADTCYLQVHVFPCGVI